MQTPPQILSLLRAARHLAEGMQANAILLLPETEVDWSQVRAELGNSLILVASQNERLLARVPREPGLAVIEIDAGPTPIQERMSLALLEAVRSEKIPHGADVVVVYNNINVGSATRDLMDTISIIHLGEHLELLNAQELRTLDTQVPLETLRAVVDLATEIGREGREGKPVGTMFVVGDTRRVLALSTPMNFNPFRGYSPREKDVRDPVVREQIKDIAQMEGAIIIRRDGVAVAACMRVHAEDQNITLSKGLGTRHAAAAAISKATRAIAVVVSQSSGAVRIFQRGEVALTIEALGRPMIWGNFRIGDENGARSRPLSGS
jgi:DNA integrity scanning protein DisA with diadenylate cyclase activity